MPCRKTRISHSPSVDCTDVISNDEFIGSDAELYKVDSSVSASSWTFDLFSKSSELSSPKLENVKSRPTLLDSLKSSSINIERGSPTVIKSGDDMKHVPSSCAFTNSACDFSVMEDVTVTVDHGKKQHLWQHYNRKERNCGRNHDTNLMIKMNKCFNLSRDQESAKTSIFHHVIQAARECRLGPPVQIGHSSLYTGCMNEFGVPDGPGCLFYQSGYCLSGSFSSSSTTGLSLSRIDIIGRNENKAADNATDDTTLNVTTLGVVKFYKKNAFPPRGRASCLFHTGLLVKCHWKHGQFTGKGRLWLPNGDHYCGDIVDSSPCGSGTMTYYESGQIYVGKWVNGLREGFGVLTKTATKNNEDHVTIDTGQSPNRTENELVVIYKGNWFLNTHHGRGVAIINIGSNDGQHHIYDGNWIYGARHGYGSQWFNVLKNEEGSLTFTHYFVGSWSNSIVGQTSEGYKPLGRRQGYGELHYPNGRKISGFWVNGRRYGQHELSPELSERHPEFGEEYLNSHAHNNSITNLPMFGSMLLKSSEAHDDENQPLLDSLSIHSSLYNDLYSDGADVYSLYTIESMSTTFMSESLHMTDSYEIQAPIVADKTKLTVPPASAPNVSLAKLSDLSSLRTASSFAQSKKKQFSAAPSAHYASTATSMKLASNVKNRTWAKNGNAVNLMKPSTTKHKNKQHQK